MKIKSILTFSFLLFCLALSGQEEEGTIEVAGSGSFDIGYAMQNSKAFQQFLPPDYKTLSDNYLTIGGTGYIMIEAFVLGFSGQAMLGQNEATDSLKTDIGGGMGFFHIGYNILRKQKLKVFPMLGIGGGGLGLKIAQNKDLNVQQVLNNPGREIHVGASNFAMDFSLTVDAIPFMDFEEDGTAGGGMKLGIRVGYILGVTKDDWKFGGGNINDAEAFGFRTFYVKFSIGGFNFNQLDLEELRQNKIKF